MMNKKTKIITIAAVSGGNNSKQKFIKNYKNLQLQVLYFTEFNL